MFSPESKLVFDNPIAFYTPNDMFNTHTYLIDPSIFFLFFARQLAAARLFLRLYDSYACYRKALKSQVLIQDTLFRKCIGFIISQPFIVPFPFICCSQTTDSTGVVNDDNILYRMLFFLSTIVQALFVGIEWSIYWAFCAVVEEKRDISVPSACFSVTVARSTTMPRCGSDPMRSNVRLSTACSR